AGTSEPAGTAASHGARRDGRATPAGRGSVHATEARGRHGPDDALPRPALGPPAAPADVDLGVGAPGSSLAALTRDMGDDRSWPEGTAARAGPSFRPTSRGLRPCATPAAPAPP